ncbi:MAG TPA: hypothetical protein PKJ16_01655 [Spirochaetota bacterium]|nr:hypothetical protein [Spirochaetota bacterium]
MATAARGWQAFTVFLEMVKIEHSIFALPFALIGMMWGSMQKFNTPWPGFWIFGWIVVAMVLMRLGYTGILPYVDPVIVIALIVVSFPVPLKVVLVEFRRLLLVSPENSIEDEVKGLLRDVIEHYGMIDVQVWALKSGRTQYFFLYSSLREEHTTIRRLDEIRLAIFRELAKQYPKFWADIMFTRINPENTTESLLESADVRVDR